jgi:heme oxygenase
MHDQAQMREQSQGLGDRLRESTRSLHDSAETHAFQRAFAAGKLPREQYVRYLAEMLHMYSALEKSIRQLRSFVPELAAVVRDQHFREGDLRADLEFLGYQQNGQTPLASTRNMVEHIEKCATERPIKLLGFHYVLEGSNNGSKFIARNVARAYGLAPGQGLAYLDPYGDQQREIWQQYKQDMASLTLTADQSEAVVDAARQMFQAIASISSELLETAEAVIESAG